MIEIAWREEREKSHLFVLSFPFLSFPSHFTSLTASNGRPLNIAILSNVGMAANDQGYALVLSKRVHGRLERCRRTDLAIASDFDDL